MNSKTTLIRVFFFWNVIYRHNKIRRSTLNWGKHNGYYLTIPGHKKILYTTDVTGKQINLLR